MVDSRDVFPPRNLPDLAINWGRVVEDRLKGVEKLAVASDDQVRALNRNTASSIEILADQVFSLQEVIRFMPIQSFESAREDGIALTNTFVSRASVPVAIPPGKNRAQVMCIGSAAVLDATSGGVTTAYARISIAGDLSGEFPASKDAGATQVNNVMVATHSVEFEVSEVESFNVAIQLRGLNGSAFPSSPSNFAQITVSTLFTSV